MSGVHARIGGWWWKRVPAYKVLATAVTLDLDDKRKLGYYNPLLSSWGTRAGPAG